MAFNAGSVKGTLELGVQKFKRSVDKATGGFKRMGGAANKASKNVGGFGKNFARNMKLMVAAVVGAAVIKKTFDGIKKVMVEGSKAQQEYEQSARSLRATFEQGGAVGAKLDGLVKSMEDYAAVVQKTTQFADVDVLGVAQTLRTMNVAEEDLEEFTGAVLDYAAKTGLDAVQSARQFGKSLAGLSGELGDAFPSVRAMSQETLKAGGAFKAATVEMGGFAAEIGGTTENRIKRMKNAFTDVLKRVGEVVNQLAGPLATALQSVFENMTSQLKEGEGGFAAMGAAMTSAFVSALNAVKFLVEGFYQVRVAMNNVQLGGAYIQQAIVTAIAASNQAVLSLTASLYGVVQTVANFVASIPGLSEGIKESIQSVADFAEKTIEANNKAKVSWQDMRDAAAEVVTERKKEVAAAEESLRLLREGVKGQGVLHNGSGPSGPGD